jgi:hypothetical protein
MVDGKVKWRHADYGVCCKRFAGERIQGCSQVILGIVAGGNPTQESLHAIGKSQRFGFSGDVEIGI